MGDTGEQGPAGLSISATGVVYVVWGQTTCPSTTGTELLHQGLVAAAHRSDTGTGTNYLCLPNNPNFDISIDPSAIQYAAVVGVKYMTANESLGHLDNKGVPCSVCYTDQVTQLMIPGIAACPNESWRVEYIGYLMSSRDTPSNNLQNSLTDSNFRTKYICVSSNAEGAPSVIGNNEAELYHVYLDCDEGTSLGCSTGSQQITCAVCTLNNF